MNSLNIKKEREGGFTLLELLIVISIIAILSVALVLVLNPAEALKKSRDAQRISDLSTMKTALGLYLTSTSSPRLGTGNVNTLASCKTSPTSSWGTTHQNGSIYYSSPTSITDTTLDGATGTSIASSTPGVTNLALTNGAGWIPVNFDSLTGGSPISNLPIDPTNAFVDGNVTSVGATDLFYRYACSASPLSFEIDATLESDAYTVADDKRATDGGNSNFYYEVGTNLRIMGASAAGIDF